LRTKWLLFLILLLGMSSNTYAYFCSSQKGHGYVNIGDTLQEVQRICGTPDHEVKVASSGEKNLFIQNWTYTHQPIQTRFDSPTPQSDTEYPPDVTFQIVNNKVNLISVQGRHVMSSNLCRTGMQVKLGQSAQSVMDSCGRPDFVHSQQQKVKTPQQQIITWTYDAPSGQPIVFEFTNEKLTKIGN